MQHICGALLKTCGAGSTRGVALPVQEMLLCRPESDLLKEADRLAQLEATWSSTLALLLWQHAACPW